MNSSTTLMGASADERVLRDPFDAECAPGAFGNSWRGSSVSREAVLEGAPDDAVFRTLVGWTQLFGR